MGDYWRTSGRSRLKARAKSGLASRAEKRAAVVRADYLCETAPAPSNRYGNFRKKPRVEVCPNGMPLRDPLAQRGIVASSRPSKNLSGPVVAGPRLQQGQRILTRDRTPNLPPAYAHRLRPPQAAASSVPPFQQSSMSPSIFRRIPQPGHSPYVGPEHTHLPFGINENEMYAGFHTEDESQMRMTGMQQEPYYNEPELQRWQPSNEQFDLEQQRYDEENSFEAKWGPNQNQQMSPPPPRRSFDTQWNGESPFQSSFREESGGIDRFRNRGSSAHVTLSPASNPFFSSPRAQFGRPTLDDDFGESHVPFLAPQDNTSVSVPFAPFETQDNIEADAWTASTGLVDNRQIWPENSFGAQIIPPLPQQVSTRANPSMAVQGIPRFQSSAGPTEEPSVPMAEFSDRDFPEPKPPVHGPYQGIPQFKEKKEPAILSPLSMATSRSALQQESFPPKPFFPKGIPQFQRRNGEESSGVPNESPHSYTPRQTILPFRSGIAQFQRHGSVSGTTGGEQGICYDDSTGPFFQNQPPNGSLVQASTSTGFPHDSWTPFEERNETNIHPFPLEMSSEGFVQRDESSRVQGGIPRFQVRRNEEVGTHTSKASSTPTGETMQASNATQPPQIDQIATIQKEDPMESQNNSSLHGESRPPLIVHATIKTNPRREKEQSARDGKGRSSGDSAPLVFQTYRAPSSSKGGPRIHQEMEPKSTEVVHSKSKQKEAPLNEETSAAAAAIITDEKPDFENIRGGIGFYYKEKRVDARGTPVNKKPLQPRANQNKTQPPPQQKPVSGSVTAQEGTQKPVQTDQNVAAIHLEIAWAKQKSQKESKLSKQACPKSESKKGVILSPQEDADDENFALAPQSNKERNGERDDDESSVEECRPNYKWWLDPDYESDDDELMKTLLKRKHLWESVSK